MAQPCAIPMCKRTSRALCHCCQNNLCRDHLIEHDDILNSQLNPLADEINVFSNRVIVLSLDEISHGSRQKFDKWRLDCHQMIDHYFEQKCHELIAIIT